MKLKVSTGLLNPITPNPNIPKLNDNISAYQKRLGATRNDAFMERVAKIFRRRTT